MKSIKKFHSDERGMEALQVILIVAIAAIVLALLKFAWPNIKDWFVKNVGNILGFGDSTGGASQSSL